jgi:hypothetical protein
MVNKGDEIPVSKPKRMMIRMINEMRGHAKTSQ